MGVAIAAVIYIVLTWWFLYWTLERSHWLVIQVCTYVRTVLSSLISVGSDLVR